MLEPLRQRRKRDGDRERGERERDSRQAQGGNPEHVADHARDESGDRDREECAHPVLGQDVRGMLADELEAFLPEDEQRRRVAPDRHERGMAERDLAVVPRKDVETEQRDEVDPDERELAEPELAREPWQQRNQHNRPGKYETLQRRRGPATHQTLLTTTRPKRPVGRITSTSSSTAKAVGNLSSWPTKLT